MKIHAKTLIPVVLDFIVTYVGEEEAEEFARICDTTMEKANTNPLVQAGGFNALLKIYLRQYPSMKDKICTSDQPEAKEESSSSESESDTKSENGKNVVKPKTSKPAVEKKESESDSDSSSSEEEKPATKVTAGTKRKSSDPAPEPVKRQKTEETVETFESVEPVYSNKRTTFSRIKKDYADNLSHEFQDNSFEAKVRYGKGGDDYGIHSNERLRVVTGKDFRKQKTKMKNKNFHGQGNKLVYKCNSIKF